MKRVCALFCAMVFSSTLFANLDSDQLVAQSAKAKKKYRDNNTLRNPNSWRPYYLHLTIVEPSLTSFYQQNVGVGFLYFSGIQGNVEPTTISNRAKSDKKLTGHLMYNRTPLVECILGSDIFYWWKVALSYQHQGGIVVQTRPQIAMHVLPANSPPSDFIAHVRLDTIMLKTYFMLPWVLVWKNVYHEPYFGIAVGPGWQTWTDIHVSSIGTALRPKFSANCVYTIDLGFKLRKVLPNYIMSFTLGCKYNQWGQARSMGKLRDQYPSSATTVAAGGNGRRAALFNPIRIKTVYQFAPYIGVMFNF